MNEMLMLLVVAYIFLLALLMLVLLYGRISWLVKLFLVLITSGLYWVSYQGWKQVQGWPSDNELPAKFLLHASVIEEPDQEHGTGGKIYIWASNLQGNKPAGEPRAYTVAYDREVHSSLQDALRNQRNGNVQIGVKERNKNIENAAPVNVRQLGQVHEKLKFIELPDPALPEK
jgi:Ca2+/Na+ antiporter